MEQLTMFDGLPAFPLTHEDVLALHARWIAEGETDEDAFTWSETSAGKSYFFYGRKVFAHKPGDVKTARLILFEEVTRVNDEGDEVTELKPRSKAANNFDGGQLAAALVDLREKKRWIFRHTVTEQFACCNDFKQCSAVGACIHQEDRFYNGCFYRTNLEAGRNFFREGGEA